MAFEMNSPAFSDSLVILGAAGLVIPAFARFRVSPVIGFILVGLLVGPAGLGRMVDEFPWLYYMTITEPGSIAPRSEEHTSELQSLMRIPYVVFISNKQHLHLNTI